MKCITTPLAAGVFFCLLVGVASPAWAASPLAAIPVGSAVNYHVTTQTNKPPVEGGQQSTDNYVRIARTSVTAFNVQVDGAPAGQITVNSDGSLHVPSSLKNVLAPFGEMALLMHGAPQPLAPTSSWAADVPIPLAGSTDHVAATVAVTQLSQVGAEVVANGQNATTVRPVLREHPADINFNTAMTFNQAREVTYANSNVSVVVHEGAFRTKHSGMTWTVSLAGP